MEETLSRVHIVTTNAFFSPGKIALSVSPCAFVHCSYLFFIMIHENHHILLLMYYYKSSREVFSYPYFCQI